MVGKDFASRDGTVLLLLLVVLIIGGIVAARLLPNEELISRRNHESSLNTEISQIREAFDLMKVASPTWKPWDDFVQDHSDAPASIALVLQFLGSSGYLLDGKPADPTVMKHRWGTATDKVFWKVSSNLASNSSFQIKIEGQAGWDWSQTDTVAATDTVFLNDMRVDDYPFQNKLGNLLGKAGASLKITR